MGLLRNDVTHVKRYGQLWLYILSMLLSPPSIEFFDKSSIADLVAHHGSSNATAWLENSRYKIWRPSYPILESDFLPAQGYMQKDRYVFAWGNPLVSHPAALRPTAGAFREWAESLGLYLVWCCVDHDLQCVLAEPPFNWCVVTCINEDVVDPAHVMWLTSPDAVGKDGAVSFGRDLKKNLKRAQKDHVEVQEIRSEDWEEADKIAVEDGIQSWLKSRTGIQIATTTVQPWLDSHHRRYWLARHHENVVGIIILTPIQGNGWEIKNAISFLTAPRGTSETLIYTALRDLHQEKSLDEQPPLTVTFGISAADEMESVQNLSGWKLRMLAKLYNKIASTAGLLRRSEFRQKFGSKPHPMYVCYPENGLGLGTVNALLQVLMK